MVLSFSVSLVRIDVRSYNIPHAPEYRSSEPLATDFDGGNEFLHVATYISNPIALLLELHQLLRRYDRHGGDMVYRPRRRKWGTSIVGLSKVRITILKS